MNIAKFLRAGFFIQHLLWLLLRVLYKKAVLKILQTSPEHIIIGALFYKVAGLQLPDL